MAPYFDYNSRVFPKDFMETLVWFRSDFRLLDNPALRNAFEQSMNVHALFIFSNIQLKKHNEASVKVDFLKSNFILRT